MRDKLDDDALEARKLGLSYGKYMAIKPRASAAAPAPGDNRRVCVICGSPLTRRKQEKYCCEACRMTAQKRKKRGGRDGK